VRQPHLLDLRDSHLHGLSQREKKKENNIQGRKIFFVRLVFVIERSVKNSYLPTVLRFQHLKSLAAEVPDVF